MKNISTILFLSLSITAYSQDVISSQGDSYSNGNGSIDFTVGEVVINTGTDGINDITQGFHQTNWNFVGLEDHSPEIEVKVYPNPSTNVLFISTSDYQNVRYLLIDNLGKVVTEGNLVEEKTAIDVQNIAPANYRLILMSGDKKLKMFHLVKLTQ